MKVTAIDPEGQSPDGPEGSPNIYTAPARLGTGPPDRRLQYEQQTENLRDATSSRKFDRQRLQAQALYNRAH